MSLNTMLDRPASARRAGDDQRLWPGWVRLVLIVGVSAGLWGAIFATVGRAISHH